MAFSEALAERIRQRLAQRKNVAEKKMFGGVGFLLNGNMLVGVWKESLVVRLGKDEGEEALLEPHVKEFDITGRAMKGWGLHFDAEGRIALVAVQSAEYRAFVEGKGVGTVLTAMRNKRA